MVSSKKDKDTILQVETKKPNKKNTTQHVIEVEYWHILPALRREIATYLKDSKQLKQKEIALILGITEAGVSQYLKGTRGVLKTDDAIIEVPGWIKEEVSKSCELFLKNNTDTGLFLKEVNRILLAIRERPREFLCSIHNEFGFAESDCDICENA